MKLLSIISLLFVVGCTEVAPVPDDNSMGFDLTVVTIDGCEYIQYYPYNAGQHITHKGNCKYCAERNRK